MARKEAPRRSVAVDAPSGVIALISATQPNQALNSFMQYLLAIEPTWAAQVQMMIAPLERLAIDMKKPI